MLKEKIKRAEENIPGNVFRVNIKGKVLAVLRDKDGNIKETREVEL